MSYNINIKLKETEAMDILKNVQKTIKPGVFHCCPLNPELIKEGLKLDEAKKYIIKLHKKISKSA